MEAAIEERAARTCACDGCANSVAGRRRERRNEVETDVDAAATALAAAAPLGESRNCGGGER